MQPLRAKIVLAASGFGNIPVQPPSHFDAIGGTNRPSVATRSTADVHKLIEPVASKLLRRYHVLSLNMLYWPGRISSLGTCSGAICVFAPRTTFKAFFAKSSS